MRLAWQAGILVIISIGLANNLSGIAQSFQSGTFGLTYDRIHGSRIHLRVDSVDRGSSAAQAGVRPGDTLVLTPTPSTYESINNTAPGDTLVVRDGDRTINLTAFRDTSSTPQLSFLLAFGFAKVSFAAMALLIILRRPDEPVARSLALFLAAFSFAMLYDLIAFPGLWVRLLSSFLVAAAFMTAEVALLSFTCYFPSMPARGMRHTIAKAIPVIGAIAASFVLGSVALSYFSGRDLNTFVFVTLPQVIVQGAILLTSCAALVNAYLTSPPQERPRMRWLAGTLIAGLSGIFVIYACAVIGININAPSIQCFAFTVLLIPFGLTYVILRHRMLDITFVINRAVVYTVVSIVMLGSLIVFERILGQFVEQNSRVSSILQLAAALALGFSVRYIHNRVDKYVDDLFFRERHNAEAAVRRFAHEALMITDPLELVGKTTEVAERNMRLSACAFFSHRGKQFEALTSTFAKTPAVSENDFAVLKMRTWHSPVFLPDTQTALPGELALPMIVRGELAGFLLCGDKCNHEAFAPDERDALEQLARDAGIAFDSLRVQELERELARLERLVPRDATGGGVPAI